MLVRVVIFPAEDGLNVVLWGKWTRGTMRTRFFESRSEMISTLVDLGLINREDGAALEQFTFEDTCPLYTSEIEEADLIEHGFQLT